MARHEQTNSSHEKKEHYPDGLAPERSGNGTFDNGWQPGDHDPNVEGVYKRSLPDKPGIAPPPRMVDIGGVLFPYDQAIFLGYTEMDIPSED